MLDAIIEATHSRAWNTCPTYALGLRERAIMEGMPLLGWEEINAEVSDRRGRSNW